MFIRFQIYLPQMPDFDQLKLATIININNNNNNNNNIIIIVSVIVTVLNYDTCY